MLLTSYFLVSWIPTVLTFNGMSAEHAAMAAVIINCGGIVGTLILSFIIGRKSPLAPVVGVSMCGRHPDCAARPRHRLAGNTKFLLVFAVGLADHRRPGRYSGAVRTFVSCLGLCDGRGVIRCLRPIGSIIGPLVGGYLVSARLGWSRLFLLAAVPALSAALAMAALALTRTKRRRTPMNGVSDAAQRDATFRGNVASSTDRHSGGVSAETSCQLIFGVRIHDNYRIRRVSPARCSSNINAWPPRARGRCSRFIPTRSCAWPFPSSRSTFPARRRI